MRFIRAAVPNTASWVIPVIAIAAISWLAFKAWIDGDYARLALFVAGGLAVFVAGYVLNRDSWIERLQEELIQAKRAENEQRLLARQCQLALDSANMGCWRYEPKTDLMLWDDRFKEIFGLSGLKGSLRDVFKHLHGEDLPGATRALEEALNPADPKPYSAEYRILLKDESVRWVEAHGLPVTEDESPDRRPSSLIGIVRDITKLKLTEEKSRRNEQRLQRFFSSDMVGAVYWNVDGKITEANDKFLRMFGYSREDLLEGRMNWVELTPVEYRGLEDRGMAELQKTGVATPFEKECFRKDGSRFPVILGAARVDDQSGVAFVLDITKLKQVEEERERLTAIVKSSQDAIAWKDVNGIVRSWNRGAEQMFGYTAEEIIGKPANALVPPDRVHEEDDLIEALRAGKRVDQVETVRLTKDGRPVEVSVTVSPVKDRAGRLVGASNIIRNITERKRFERDLERRNQKMALLSEAAAGLLAAKDPKGMVEELFSRVGAFLGADIFLNYMLQGGNWPLVLDVAGGLDAKTRSAFAKLEKGEALCGTAAQLRRPVYVSDLQHCDNPKACGLRDLGVRAYACYVLTAGDRLLGTLSFASRTKDHFSDEELGLIETISHYIAIARERIRTEKALREAAAAKDQFLAVLSHELRTPLAPVLAAVSLIERKESLSTGLRHDLEIIKRNVGLEARLIDDLLDLTRIVRGKVTLERRATNICNVIERVVEICKPDLEARKLHFSVEYKEREIPVDGDVSRLQQVFWNLLKNSVKFTPDGGCVGIRCARKEGNASIEVIDSGIGIQPEAMSRIFNAFEQEDRITTRQFGGLGLGLAISKRLVDMHNGSLTAHSEGKGRGSTFRVTLPLHAEHREQEHQDIASPSAADMRACRILLVEDHGDTAEMMRELLESSGHEVETAGDVAQALAAVKSHEFDVLVSDLGLPDKSGIELMQELRKCGNPIKGIALSGFGQEEDVTKSKEVGFSEHLTKPVDFEVLADAVERIAH